MFFGVDPYELLHTYGYWTILIWTFLEGETVVIIAGILASQGYLDPKLIAICAFCGSVSIDQLMFLLGKYKGRAALDRFPKLAKRAERAERLVRKYETVLILSFRFIYGVRNVTAIMLGINRVNHLKFLLLNIIGAAVWATAFTYGGYFLGALFEKIIHDASLAILYTLGAAAVLGTLIWYIRQRRRTKELMQIIKGNEGREKEASQHSNTE